MLNLTRIHFPMVKGCSSGGLGCLLISILKDYCYHQTIIVTAQSHIEAYRDFSSVYKVKYYYQRH